MPNPLVGNMAPTPHGRPARHAAPPDRGPAPLEDGSSSTTEIRVRHVADPSGPEPARPRGEIASGLPGWDLLPPVEFVRRHRGGT